MGDEPKKALYYKKLKNRIVQCQLCPHFCVLKDRERGKCNVRENRKGSLYTLVYGKLCSMNLDPIEKKPLYHFLPGEQAMSIATVGCNLKCLHCQNWEISQSKPEHYSFLNLSPRQIAEKTKDSGSRIIAYTYTEPTIFYEYMLDTAKLAKKQGIKNVIVSNGFINPAPLKELCRYIDGANIDVKGNARFYQEVCGGRIEPILEAVKILHNEGVWTELTNLIIPGYNDNEKDIRFIVDFVKSLDKNIPLHFSAFYPCYKMTNAPSTPAVTIVKARDIALKAGLDYVYTGNISDVEGSTTYCPKCKKGAIARYGYAITENNIVNGRCRFCKEKIAGVWK